MDAEYRLSQTRFIDMWRVEHIDMLWWWLLIPAILLAIALLKKQRDKKLAQLAHPDKIRALIQTVPKEQILLKRTLWLSAIGLLILSLANPQSGRESDSISSSPSHVIIALDLSNSMLAKDIAPSRLDRSKKFISQLTQKFRGDRVAFIVFAGKAYIQTPFTTDYGAFLSSLQAIHTDMMPYQGTNLREAILLADAMQGVDEDEEKILILLSDGEDHDKKAVSIAKQIAANKTTIHTIGVGTTQGASIPEEVNSHELKKDSQGKTVISKLNEQVLKDIAQAGNGQYFNITQEQAALREIQRSIKWAKGSTQNEKIYHRYKSYFQWFLFPAILLLILELTGAQLWNFRKKTPTTYLILFILGSWFLTSCKHVESQHIQKLQKIEESFQFDFSEVQQQASQDSSDVSIYNLATSFLLQNQKDTAGILYSLLAESSTDSLIISKSLYNLGCISYSVEDYTASADFFKNSLRHRAQNFPAQYNLSLALEHLPPQEQDEDKQDEDENQNEENQDDDSEDSDSDGEQGDNSNENQQDGSGDGNDENEDSSNQESKQDDPSQEQQEQADEKNPSKQEQSKQELSPLELKSLYQSLEQQEKDIKRRIMTQEGKQQAPPHIEKDW